MLFKSKFFCIHLKKKFTKKFFHTTLYCCHLVFKEYFLFYFFLRKVFFFHNLSLKEFINWFFFFKSFSFKYNFLLFKRFFFLRYNFLCLLPLLNFNKKKKNKKIKIFTFDLKFFKKIEIKLQGFFYLKYSIYFFPYKKLFLIPFYNAYIFFIDLFSFFFIYFNLAFVTKIFYHNFLEVTIVEFRFTNYYLIQNPLKFYCWFFKGRGFLFHYFHIKIATLLKFLADLFYYKFIIYIQKKKKIFFLRLANIYYPINYRLKIFPNLQLFFIKNNFLEFNNKFFFNKFYSFYLFQILNFHNKNPKYWRIKLKRYKYSHCFLYEFITKLLIFDHFFFFTLCKISNQFEESNWLEILHDFFFFKYHLFFLFFKNFYKNFKLYFFSLNFFRSFFVFLYNGNFFEKRQKGFFFTQENFLFYNYFYEKEIFIPFSWRKRRNVIVEHRVQSTSSFYYDFNTTILQDCFYKFFFNFKKYFFINLFYFIYWDILNYEHVFNFFSRLLGFTYYYTNFLIIINSYYDIFFKLFLHNLNYYFFIKFNNIFSFFLFYFHKNEVFQKLRYFYLFYLFIFFLHTKFFLRILNILIFHYSVLNQSKFLFASKFITYYV